MSASGVPASVHAGQHRALEDAGVGHRGRLGGRPRKMDRATLTMAMAAMADHKAVAADVARRLGMTTTTLYTYINGDGSLKAPGHALLNGASRLTEGKGV